ncbi:MAG: dockerin type I domain-containing protein [Candidatus Bathyarchaeia archaeon]
MKNNLAKMLSALMIVTALFGFAAVLPTLASIPQPAAYVIVDPALNFFTTPSTIVGSTFNVNVSLVNITGVAGVQFQLTWNPTLLNVTTMTEVLFHTKTPSAHWGNIWNLKFAYNNTAGKADYAQAWSDSGTAQADGYAPLNVTTATDPPEGKLAAATFTFQVLKVPTMAPHNLTCAFHLTIVKILDLAVNPIIDPSKSTGNPPVDGTYVITWTPPAILPYYSVSSHTALSLGEVFNISVRVNSLDPGWEAVGFGFKLGYNSTLLQVLNVWEGSWLPPYGALPNNGTSFVKSYGSDYVEVQDAVLPDANGTWHPPYPSAPNPNSFPLAIIEFNSTMQSMFPIIYECPLHLYDTNVTDWLAEPVTPTIAVDGLYQILPAIPLVSGHDVAVTSVECSKTVIGEGYSEIVNVTVADVGNYTETFNVTAYANTTAMGKEEATLTSGSSMSLMFAWDTTGYSYGNYTISAVADTVPNETNTANNNMTDGSVVVTIPGDINGDGTVDIYDAILLAGAFNSSPGSKRWNPNADINGDGIVDIYDAIIQSGHFNQHYP